MTTSARKSPATTKTAPSKPAAKLASKKSAPTVEPSLRFHHTHDLRAKTEAVLNAIDDHPAHRDHGDALADLVGELVEAGMDFYFMRGLKMAEVGFLTEQSARLGMSGAVKLINSVSRKFIVRMDGAQLQAVAVHIRSLT